MPAWIGYSATDFIDQSIGAVNNRKRREMNVNVGYSRFVLLVLVTFLPCRNAGANGGSTAIGGWDIDFSLVGGFIHQNYDTENPPTVRMPGYIENERRNSEMADYYTILTTDKLTDNPLIHGAVFADAALKAGNAGLTLICRLMMEHRGASYGTYALDDVTVIPKYLLSIDTSFTIGGQSFNAGVEAGNFDDHKLYEGLTIHNMDVQGCRFYLQWRRLKLEMNHIGDMDRGIGLNINDQRDYVVSVSELALFERFKVDAAAGRFDYCRDGDYESGLPDNGVNVSAGLRWRESVRLYSQVAMRNIRDSSHGGIKRCASLIGCTVRGRAHKFDFDLTTEYRFYGRYFNQDLKCDGNCFLYRGYEGYGGECSSWNTAGSYLYPLSVFLRPFGQWAVYTDYQGRDVQSLIFRADVSYGLPGNCEAICNLDFNYIDASNEDAFLYPFYDVGLGWVPVAGTSITLRHTNRAMNLDRHYPTLYLLNRGLFMITFEGALSF
jgi:hypothetical protein